MLALPDLISPKDNSRSSGSFGSGDLYQAVMDLDGVEHVCLNRFKRVGKSEPDSTGTGRIVLEADEIAVCYNEPDRAELGYITVKVHGGKRG